MQVEDMRHLAIIADLDRELQELIISYNRRAEGVTARDEALSLRLEQNTHMLDVLTEHRRVLRYHLGLPYEPVAHEAVAVLEGVGGGSAS